MIILHILCNTAKKHKTNFSETMNGFFLNFFFGNIPAIYSYG